MNIPENLDHLDAYSPEELGLLIIIEIQRDTPSLDLIRTCIQTGASLDIQHSRGLAPLHVAAKYGHLEIVQALIEAGASLDVKKQPSDWTPLHCAAWRNHLGCVLALISAGASLDVRDCNGNTPWNLTSTMFKALCPELSPCIAP